VQWFLKETDINCTKHLARLLARCNWVAIPAEMRALVWNKLVQISQGNSRHSLLATTASLLAHLFASEVEH
jgi:hypothetical protein